MNQLNFSFIIKAMEGPEDVPDVPVDGVLLTLLASTLSPGVGIGDRKN